MCSLRYEHEFYVQSRRRFPKEGRILRTARGEEKVTTNDIFRDRVTLRGVDGEIRTLPLAELRREVEQVAAELGIPAPAIGHTAATDASTRRDAMDHEAHDRDETALDEGHEPPVDVKGAGDSTETQSRGEAATDSAETLAESSADASEEADAVDGVETGEPRAAGEGRPRRRRGRRGGRRNRPAGPRGPRGPAGDSPGGDGE